MPSSSAPSSMARLGAGLAALHRTTDSAFGWSADNAIGATPQANSLYPVLPRRAADALQAWSFFYPWNASTNQYRWMTAWDTTEQDVKAFADGVRRVLASAS